MGIVYSDEEKKKHLEDDLNRLQKFRLMDDTFMRAVLKNNLKMSQYILRVVTGLSDRVLTLRKRRKT